MPLKWLNQLRQVRSSPDIVQPSGSSRTLMPTPAPRAIESAGKEEPATAAATPDSVNKPVVSPTTRKAALNAFKSALEVLGKAPLPGIGMVSTVVLRIIKGLEETSEVEVGWDRLAERMERLSAFLIEMNKSDSLKSESIERHCNGLKTELEKLANAIEEALTDRTRKSVTFWNTADSSSSVNSYGKRLDSSVGDLILVFCGTIGLQCDGLEKRIQAYIEGIHADILKDKNATRMIMAFTENKIGFVGPAAKINADNKNKGAGDMQMTANKNEIGMKFCNLIIKCIADPERP
ncbi:hypothetical protein B0H13DRAFT_1896264 [Mycena leptocephala]|nr:hypothetical protein B0H13DRAFT_1896264 [Mycena leptocephala]